MHRSNSHVWLKGFTLHQHDLANLRYSERAVVLPTGRQDFMDHTVGLLELGPKIVAAVTYAGHHLYNPVVTTLLFNYVQDPGP